MLRLFRNFVLFVFATGTVVAQTDFSAEMVDLRQPGTPTLAKLYFAKDKRRYDFQPASGTRTIIMPIPSPTNPNVEAHIDGRGRSFIVDTVAKTSTVLEPAVRDYYQSPTSKLRVNELYGLYYHVHPVNAEDACSEWMKVPGADKETCRNLGVDFVNGRVAIKYDLSCYGEVCHLWVDRKLHFLIKRETKWTSTELHNIQEGPQPASLFAIPLDYTLNKIPGGIIGFHEPQ